MSELSETIKSSVSSFSNSARKRIRDNSSVKKGIELTVNRMVQAAVSNCCFVYISRLRVGNIERAIVAVFIFAFMQIAVKC